MTVSADVQLALLDLLGARCAAKQLDWLRDRCQSLQAGASERDLAIAFGLVPRRVGKGPLAPSPQELQSCAALVPGWNPQQWGLADCARLVLLLAIPENDVFARLQALFDTAAMDELVVLYRGLPLYPQAEAWQARAAEGLRSNMQVVFEAVAHDNPYPSAYLSEDAWNQMVLKALFIASPLGPIQGLRQRANPTLTTMLCDYADERWAASRPIPKELWRPVAACADARALASLVTLSRSEDDDERRIAAFALEQSDDGRTVQNQEAIPASGVNDWQDLFPLPARS